ncbi:MAG: ATP-dependent zinc metalloprotease FtsH [Abditibacteriota bacterium]|nr:ATP-dependent zinc metalloprotease FtsH [Abditibacteriota bacterium]
MIRLFRALIPPLLIVALLYALFGGKGSILSEEKTFNVSYSEAMRKVETEKISAAEIYPNDTATLTAKTGEKYEINLPREDMAKSGFIEQLQKHNIKTNINKPIFSDSILSLLVGVLLPLGLLVFLWMMFMRQAGGGPDKAMSFGRSRAQRVNSADNPITFNDVAGVDEAKEELAEVVDFLAHPDKYRELGAEIPKGVLLLGPPGCGKTLLARAVAGEAGVPFFQISGSDFVEMFVGVGASRVRDLFDTAKSNRPCLIFIDEIDAVGRQRGAGLGGGNDEREQTLNQLLVEMDGFEKNSGVILIAATNRPDVLDPALLRPGRFDRQVTVDRPDAKGRVQILKVHMRKLPHVGTSVSPEKLAKRTPGFSGADLANLVNEAALLAARRSKSFISEDEFNDAIDKVIAGPERKGKVMNEKERRTVAYHELGHAFVSELSEGGDPVHKVSILPRGMALGYTMQMPEEDKYLSTKSELLSRVAGLLGGRVAEELIFGEASTGASNDLERATEIVRAMICEYGMSDKIGPLTVGRRHGNPFLGRDVMEDRNYGELTAKLIDEEVRATVDGAYAAAKEILESHMDKLHYMAKVLLAKETFEREEFLELLNGDIPDDAKADSEE